MIIILCPLLVYRILECGYLGSVNKIVYNSFLFEYRDLLLEETKCNCLHVGVNSINSDILFSSVLHAWAEKNMKIFVEFYHKLFLKALTQFIVFNFVFL